jgi:sugar phosphate permease
MQEAPDQPTATPPPARKARYYFGWNIVIASVISQAAYFHHFASSLGLFLEPMQAELGLSATAVAGVQTTTRVLEGVAAPVVGPLVDRFGPRVLMPIGGVILALSLWGTAVCHSVWMLYLLRGVIASIGFALMGDIVTGVAIGKWFVKKRGRAMGFSRTAMNVAGIVLSPLTVWVIVTRGWRTAFFVYGALALFCAAIPPLFLMRRSPEDLGLQPDGGDAGGEKEDSRKGSKKFSKAPLPTDPVWTKRSTLRTGAFWMLSASFAINVLAYQGMNMNLPKYVKDVGHGVAMIGAVMSGRFIIQAVAAVLMGFLAEYADRVSVRIVPFILQGLGAFFFMYAKNPYFLWLALVLFSIGQPGVQILQEVVFANFFGRRSLGVVLSLGYFVIFASGALGPVAMSLARDITGSYQSSFVVLVGLFALATVMLGMARPPKPKAYVTPGAPPAATGLAS